MRRRVIAVDAFYEAIGVLDKSQETVRAGRALLLRAAIYPESSRRRTALGIRIIMTPRYGGFTPLRLFYWCDDLEVYLLHMDRYAEPLQ